MSNLSLWALRILLVGLICIELAGLTGIVQGEYNWFGGMVVTALLAWGITEANKKFYYHHTHSPLPFFVPLTALIAIYLDALGDIFHWYGQFTWYDQLVHAMGGLATACAFYFFFEAWVTKKGLPHFHWPIALSAISATAWLSSLYEIEEYLEDYFRGFPMRLGDGPDTANDMLCSLIGSLIVVVIITAYQKDTHAAHTNNKLEA